MDESVTVLDALAHDCGYDTRRLSYVAVNRSAKPSRILHVSTRQVDHRIYAWCFRDMCCRKRYGERVVDNGLSCLNDDGIAFSAIYLCSLLHQERVVWTDLLAGMNARRYDLLRRRAVL